MKLRGLWIFPVVAAMLAGAAIQAKPKDGEPERVTVQHLLISFKRQAPGKKIDRTKAEARALAEELLERVRAITDDAEFTALVEEYTDDSAPGIYILVNDDQPLVRGARKRRGMVPRFGDVAFSLEVGEVGLAAFHAGSSPYGWHIIKRLE